MLDPSIHIHPYPFLINTLRSRQNGHHFADDIFKCIFLNENVWIMIKISLTFVPKGPINNIPALFQIMAWPRAGDKPLSETMMVSLPTHICVTRPQWVKVLSVSHSMGLVAPGYGALRLSMHLCLEGQCQLGHTLWWFCIFVPGKQSKDFDMSMLSYLHQHAWLLMTSLALSMSHLIYQTKRPESSEVDVDYVHASVSLHNSCIELVNDSLMQVNLVDCIGK